MNYTMGLTLALAVVGVAPTVSSHPAQKSISDSALKKQPHLVEEVALKNPPPPLIKTLKTLKHQDLPSKPLSR